VGHEPRLDEEHTMSDDGAVKDAWAEVGEAFKEIGRRFQDSYHQVAGKADERGDQVEDSVERSLDAVKAALKDTVAAIDEVAKDPAAKEEAKGAGNSLLHALGTTLSELGESIQRSADRKPSSPPSS
jgi:ElaB/YqjD/DUF883 family membrane-anchored ribosome-binding protein